MDLDRTLADDMDWQGAAQAHGAGRRIESDSLGHIAVPAQRLRGVIDNATAIY